MDKMEGVSLHDPDLDRLTGLYRDNGGHYWVLERDGQVVGASAWRRWRAKSPAIASCRNCSSSPARAGWAWRAIWWCRRLRRRGRRGIAIATGNHRTVERGDRAVLRAGVHPVDGTARQHRPSRLQRVHAEKSAERRYVSGFKVSARALCHPVNRLITITTFYQGGNYVGDPMALSALVTLVVIALWASARLPSIWSRCCSSRR